MNSQRVVSYTEPLFSIVIANYNHGKFLSSAIESILSQSFKDFELIVVDGGSVDESLDVIRTYDRQITWWISEKDGGQSDAFNKGFTKARGQFFFWLNADDVLLPDSLMHASLAIAKNPECRWYVANTIFFSENGRILKCSVGPKWRDLLMRGGSIYVYGPTSIFHRSLFEKVGGFDVKCFYSMDTDLWLRFYNLGQKFMRLDKFFWGFRIHQASKTSHTLVGAANSGYLKEQISILSSNRHEVTSIKKFLLYIYKIMSGCYISTLYFTLKWRGKSIYDFHNTDY